MADDPQRPDLVLFDLDGTLVQSREAAWSYFRPIAQRYDLPFSSAHDFHEIFARNFGEGLRAACPDEATFARVKSEYFAILERDYAPPLVPGMREVVVHLAERTTLGVVSSNVLKVVRRVLEANDIATCIGHVFTGDVNPSKADVIRKLRANPGFTLGRHCAPHYDESQRSLSPSTSAIYLVTDTVGDVEEARSVGARAIGVSWGMHDAAELLRAGADDVVLWPQELVAMLGQGPVLGTCDVPPISPGAVAAGGSIEPPPEPGHRGSVLERVRASNAAARGVPTGAGTAKGTAAGRPDACSACRCRPGGDGPPAAPPCATSSSDAPSSVAPRVDPEVRAAVVRTAGHDHGAR